ncbi:hypothetical protein [Anaerostipes sp.]|uniref:hypothetical protein n=1 Tax=Anaerostipes sp. TaxID=1872530 RepID=UPI0025C6819F|nr:hypothetical protein [Anaerostipes sp.]MBS7008041.1 hypothetical protein [Anaerostipes sp.]
MHRNRKKYVLFIMSLVLLLFITIPVFAEDGNITATILSEEDFVEDNEISPYSLATEKARCYFSSNKNPLVLCAKFRGTAAEKSISIKLSLQKFVDGKWKVEQSWTGNTKKKVFTITKRKSVGVGRYRGKAVFTVKTNSKSETFTKYSNVIDK